MDALERLIDLPLPVFIGMTMVVMGGASILTGQAVASTWRPVWQVFFYGLLLGIATRFFSLALFQDDPFFHPGRWAYGTVVDAVVLIGYALLSYRITHVARMASQYPWLIRRTGLLTYRRIDDNSVDATSE